MFKHGFRFVVLPALVFTAGSCSGDSAPGGVRSVAGNSNMSANGGSNPGGAGTGVPSGNGNGTNPDDGLFGGDPSVDPGDDSNDGSEIGDGCAGVSEEAENASRPVDIIFVIDNSSSMAGEIIQVQQRINEDFAQIIEQSGVDYRVIMVARYGEVNTALGSSDHPICVGGALGGQDCADPQNTPLMNNAPRFFHYSADIRSREPWCRLLEGFGNPDELGGQGRPWTPVAPNGWGEFLRAEASKSFVVITDDNSRCGKGDPDTDDYQPVNGQPFAYSFNDENPSEAIAVADAAEFDAALLALSPEQFGTANARNYKWYSIVGMGENEPAIEPWAPDAPLVFETCPNGAVGPGVGFQALSRLTGGLRYPSCLNDNFDAIFRAIAGGVVKGALSCEWSIPTPPAGEVFDRNQVNVRFTSGAGVQSLVNFVSNAEGCAGPGWHYDNELNPTAVVACPQTCSLLQADPDGRVDVVFGCETQDEIR